MARGEGKTLQEAIDDWAEQKGAELLDRLGDASHSERLAAVRDETHNPFHRVVISIQVRPRNQWVRAYRVEDGA